MEINGDKTQRKKNKGKMLPPRKLKDIKTEVGEDTHTLLKNIKVPEEQNTKISQKTQQTSLRVGNPAKKQEQKKKHQKEDIPESKIINVKNIPDTNQLTEVKDFNELKKIEKTFKFINCYEDKIQKIYFVGNYFYRIR